MIEEIIEAIKGIYVSFPDKQGFVKIEYILEYLTYKGFKADPVKFSITEMVNTGMLEYNAWKDKVRIIREVTE